MSKRKVKESELTTTADSQKKRSWTVASGLLAVAAIAFAGYSFLVKGGMEARVEKHRHELKKVQSKREQVERFHREALRILEEQKKVGQQLRQQ